ncbi:hypothetical protein C2S52_001776 [Perilla frutescens var. hirtella]|nr:hypothetical protein C2S52_001776 [Perilla frutescens var. hirtella]
MLPTIYCHPSSKRSHPQGPSNSDKGKATLEATVSSTNERELLLENASLLRLSDQPTISASSQPPPLVQSNYIEVDFEAVLDHQLRSYFGLIEDTDSSLFKQLRRYLQYHIWCFQLDETTMFYLIYTRGSAFWISEGTWSQNLMNYPLSSPPSLLEIMDSMIKRIQLGISADAPLPDNEPAKSSCIPFVGDPPLPSVDEIFTSLGPMSFREQDISDPGQFIPTEDAYA